jgi:hypothetical protein
MTPTQTRPAVLLAIVLEPYLENSLAPTERAATSDVRAGKAACSSFSDSHLEPMPNRQVQLPRWRRASLLKWLRQVHGWIGLWGAALGLLFGTTGILLNHRAVLKIPAAQTQESTVQLTLPKSIPDNAQALASWLQHELHIAQPASRVREEPAKTVAWGEQSQQQPARWSVAFTSASSNLQAEYWLGNHFVSVKRSDNNLFASLNNLHKGNGASIAWILLADTLAGSIIVLSLTGVVLWAMLNRRRMLGAAIGLTALTLSLTLGFMSM